MKRTLALMMVLLLVAALFTGCQSADNATPSAAPSAAPTASAAPASSEAPAAPAELTLPLADEMTTFTGWVTSSAMATAIQKDLNENPTFQELEKRTNIHIDWTYPTQGSETESLNLMFSSQSYTDTIITMGPQSYIGGFDKFISDGVIFDLKDLIAKACPNYQREINKDESVYKAVVTDTGALPAFRMLLTERQLCYLGYYVRQDWLDAAGYTKAPVTYSDWHDMLTALKTAGSSSKEPMYYFEAILLPGYGVGADFMQQDGKVQYGPATDSFRSYLEMAAKWFSEGLIDKDFMSRRHFFLDFGEFLNGSFAMYPMVSAFYDTFSGAGMNITALPYAKLNEGDKRYINSGSAESTLQGSAGTITTNCKDPELLAKWFDYLYSDDGSLLANYGIEGQTYTMADGKPKFTDMILKNSDSLTVADAKTAYTFANLFPYLVSAERENAVLSEGAYKATEIWDTDWDISKSRSLNGDLTSEESSEYASTYNDISTYVTEFKTKVISGATTLTDDTWTEYVDQLKSMGLDRCIEIKQAALDRYNNR